METRPKYTLFPTTKFPSPPHSRGAQVPSHPKPRRSESPRPESAKPASGVLTPNERQSSPEESDTPEDMHAPRPSNSCDSSDLSFHKPTDQSCPSPPAPMLRNRPKTVYIHNGIGGRGNYHRMIKDKDNAPNQTLQPAPPRRQNNSRFFSALFGFKRGQRQQYPEDESPQSSSQTLSLGAAEVMRRKMLGQRAEGKRSSSSSNRS